VPGPGKKPGWHPRSAGMGATDLDALQGGIGCDLTGVSIWSRKNTFPCPISDRAANLQ